MTEARSRRPTFLFIGADKTGSTWLYELLRAHPACYVPHTKDIQYFDRYYSRGPDWYQQFFTDAAPSAIAVGELSHNYLVSPTAARRIAADLPEVRLIACLRQPVDRAFSHYLYMVRSGRTRAPFERVIRKYPEVLDHSRYARHLEHYLAMFDPAQIRVLYFDDLRSAPAEFGRSVLSHLGVDFLEEYDYSRQVLQAGRPRNHYLAKLAWTATAACRRVRLTSIVGSLRHSFLPRLLYAPLAETNRPRMDPTTRRSLIAEFEPEILRLEALLDVDLGKWRE